MTATAIRSIVSQVLYGDSTRLYTVPVFTDSEAARLMVSSEKVNARNHHIERRILFPRLAQSKGLVSIENVPGDSGQIADIGTKSLDSTEPSVLRKLSVFETTCLDLLPVDSSPSAPSASSVARVSPDRHAEDPDMPKKGDEIRHSGPFRLLRLTLTWRTVAPMLRPLTAVPRLRAIRGSYRGSDFLVNESVSSQYPVSTTTIRPL